MICIHDLDSATCGVCNGAAKRIEKADRPRRGPWFTAQHHGTCSGCREEEIAPGDWIRASGEGGYLCGDCGDD